MASPRLVVNVDAVRRNYTAIKKVVGPAVEASAVVKADAYGLGAKAVAKTLYGEGCRKFFVASAMEASILRKALPGTSSTLITLTGYHAPNANVFVRDGIIPAAASLDQLAKYRELAITVKRRLPVYVQFCTGMNRLGLCQRETDEFFSKFDTVCPPELLDLQCVMTHAASADAVDATQQEDQYQRFQKIAAAVPKGVKKSFANSYSIFRDPKYHYDIVRPGMALYGLNPHDYRTDRSANLMTRTVSVDVPIAQIRFTPKGEFVGYSATYQCPRDSYLATCTLGYADGLHRRVSNKDLNVFWTGPSSRIRYAMPIRGRVSMDSVIVDLTDVPEADRPTAGDFVSLICDEQTPDQVAAVAGTIGYEVLTSLGRRFERVVVGL